MRIFDILQESHVIGQLQGDDKESILREMAQHLSDAAQPQQTTDTIVQALLARERMGSTGVGEGVAIPHAKIEGIERLVACFGRKTGGISYDAIDTKPVKLIFMLLVPQHCAGAHLKALARISRLLKSSALRDRLLQLPDAGALWAAFVEEDDRPQAPKL